MEDLQSPDDDIIRQIDWNNFFDELPEGTNALEMEPPIVGDSTSSDALSNSSPDSISSWINEIENALMNDHEDDLDKGFSVPTDDCFDSFFADVLLDSHEGASDVDVVIDVDSNASDCGNDIGNSEKDDEDKVSLAPGEDCCGSFMVDVLVDSHGRSSGVDAVVDFDSNASNCGGDDDLNNSQKDKVDPANIDDSAGEIGDDPSSRKRRRYCY